MKKLLSTALGLTLFAGNLFGAGTSDDDFKIGTRTSGNDKTLTFDSGNGTTNAKVIGKTTGGMQLAIGSTTAISVSNAGVVTFPTSPTFTAGLTSGYGILLTDGSPPATQPGIAWSGAGSTGFYLQNSASIGMTLAGTATFIFSTSDLQVPAGSAATPGYGFNSATNYGLYKSGTTLGLSAAGNDFFHVDGSSGAATMGASGGAATHIINGNQITMTSSSGNASSQFLMDNSAGSISSPAVIALVVKSNASSGGNPLISFRRSSDTATAWSLGQNNGSSNRFEIAQGSSALGTNPFFAISVGGAVSFGPALPWTFGGSSGGISLSNPSADVSFSVNNTSNTSGSQAYIQIGLGGTSSTNIFTYYNGGDIAHSFVTGVRNNAGGEYRIEPGNVMGSVAGPAFEVSQNSAITIGASAGDQQHGIKGQLLEVVSAIGPASTASRITGSSTGFTSNSSQFGLYLDPVINSSASTEGYMIAAQWQNAAGSYTVPIGATMYAVGPAKGASSTVTRFAHILGTIPSIATSNAFISDASNFVAKNWGLYISNPAENYFGGPLRLNSTSAQVSNNEQFTINLGYTNTATTDGLGMGVFAGFLGNTAVTTSGGIAGSNIVTRRTTTANVTDTAGDFQYNTWLRYQFNTSGSTTYTDASNRGHNTLILEGASQLGAGTLAITNNAIINISDSGAATGTRKYGIRFHNGAISGATNNVMISDTNAFTGSWGLYLTTTNPHFFGGTVNLQGAGTNLQNAILNVSDANTNNTLLTGTTQKGIFVAPIFQSSATSGGIGIDVNILTKNTAFTMGNGIPYRAQVSAQTGSTITTVTNFLGLASNGGGTVSNFANFADNAAFSGFYALNFSSTQPSVFAGQVGIGGAQGTFALLKLGNGTNPMSGSSQYGVDSSMTYTVNATLAGIAYLGEGTTANSSFTMPELSQFYAANVAKGAASTITRQVMFHSEIPTQGTNVAEFADNNTFTGSFGLNISSSNKNLLTGPTDIGGFTDASDAASGFRGQYINSTVSTATNVTATNTWQNCTSISLTAGDWDVNMTAELLAGSGTGFSTFGAALSQNSGNSTGDHIAGDNELTTLPPTGTSRSSVTVAGYRYRGNSTVTVFGKILSIHTGGTPQYVCRVSARRVR